jgi:hypothetical protein
MLLVLIELVGSEKHDCGREGLAFFAGRIHVLYSGTYLFTTRV